MAVGRTAGKKRKRTRPPSAARADAVLAAVCDERARTRVPSRADSAGKRSAVASLSAPLGHSAGTGVWLLLALLPCLTLHRVPTVRAGLLVASTRDRVDDPSAEVADGDRRLVTSEHTFQHHRSRIVSARSQPADGRQPSKQSGTSLVDKDLQIAGTTAVDGNGHNEPEPNGKNLGPSRHRESRNGLRNTAAINPWNINHRRAAFRLDRQRLARTCPSATFDYPRSVCRSVEPYDPQPVPNDNDRSKPTQFYDDRQSQDTVDPQPGTVLQVFAHDRDHVVDRYPSDTSQEVYDYSDCSECSDTDMKFLTNDRSNGLRLPQCHTEGGQQSLGDSENDRATCQAVDTTIGTLGPRYKRNRNAADIPYRSNTIKSNLDMTSASLDVEYELTEPLNLQLGTVPRHTNDYMYTAVVVSSDASTSDTASRKREYTTHDAPSDVPTRERAQVTITRAIETVDRRSKAVANEHADTYESTCHQSSSWWRWWFPFADTWWKPKTRAEYDTDGTAFAGGSHGEVWRGKRRCRSTRGRTAHPVSTHTFADGNSASYSTSDSGNGDPEGSNHRYSRSTSIPRCERQNDSAGDGSNDGYGETYDAPLILKRLKVEHGYRHLEAGLREVYFGNYLLAESEHRFTKYVDHFFRETPRRVFGGRWPSGYGLGEKDLELWIVFEDAGPSLRSYLYTPVHSDGGFVMFQHSSLWTKLRLSGTAKGKGKSGRTEDQDRPPARESSRTEHDHERELEADDGRRQTTQTASSRQTKMSRLGRSLMQQVLRQILSAAAFLHSHGIVHRDIKPSNVMCKLKETRNSYRNAITVDELIRYRTEIVCVLGDFSSSWNNFTAHSLYTNGPSPAEQTDEYAPPESFLGKDWVPFHASKPQSYDSWSIGVLALELLLGTPNVFSVDQRTTALVTARMQKEGATDEEIHKALYLAALSNFCIFTPSYDRENDSEKNNTTRGAGRASWPLREGDPLYNAAMARKSCTLHDFHRALRARDPLGIGFDSSADLLLHLIWQLLAWDPMDRITAEEALKHPFFSGGEGDEPSAELTPGWHNAIESQMLDPRMDFNVNDTIHEFRCPKCGRRFGDWSSCHVHARSRRHANFCSYDKSSLPSCINTHSMLPTHPTSGYCDLQGRRRTIEDFHSIHLDKDMQFYGIFDGHSGNLASKFVASTLYDRLRDSVDALLPSVLCASDSRSDALNAWKERTAADVARVFEEVHASFLKAQQNRSNIVNDDDDEDGQRYSMGQSGTTATALLVTNRTVILASIGDSRAVLSAITTPTPPPATTSIPTSAISAIQLTKDHVASDDEERRLVESRGGSVVSSGIDGRGVARVNGTLAITRSIGDRHLQQYLSREPTVLAMTKGEVKERCGYAEYGRDGNDGPVLCFIILASDGLWDVMSNQEAVDVVYETIQSSLRTTATESALGHSGQSSMRHVDWEKGSYFQDAAEALALEAYVRGSSDNIGVCVVAI